MNKWNLQIESDYDERSNDEELHVIRKVPAPGHTLKC